MDTSTLIEYIGVAIGLVYLILEYRASYWLWTAGIIMSLFYIVIFYQSKFYADAGIYAYYLGANIYGLLEWRRHSKTGGEQEQADEMPITHTPTKKILPLSIIGIAIWAALWFLLHQFTDSPIPMGDSFTTALSVVAMYLLAKKHIEHWWLWVIVNLISTILYAWKGLYPMAAFFFLYTFIAAMGYVRWRKEMMKADN